MTPAKKLRVLRELYAQVPDDVGCKGLCWNNCNAVPVFAIEAQVLEAHAGRPLKIYDYKGLGLGNLDGMHSRAARALGVPNTACTFLNAGKCTAYEVRPLICRVYGAAAGIQCPHGCRTPNEITDERVFELMQRVEGLGTW